MITATILAILFYTFGNKFKKKIAIPDQIKAHFSDRHPSAKDIAWYAHEKDLFEAYFVEQGIRKSEWYDKSGHQIL